MHSLGGNVQQLQLFEGLVSEQHKLVVGPPDQLVRKVVQLLATVEAAALKITSFIVCASSNCSVFHQPNHSQSPSTSSSPPPCGSCWAARRGTLSRKPVDQKRPSCLKNSIDFPSQMKLLFQWDPQRAPISACNVFRLCCR